MRNKNLFSKSEKRKLLKFFLLGRVSYSFNKKPLSLFQTITRTIKGIGFTQSLRLSKLTGINLQQKLNDTEVDLHQFDKLEREVNASLPIDRTLERIVDENIQRKIKAGTYKGQMFLFGLPVRGQRTKTNAMTSKKRAKYKNVPIEDQSKIKKIKK